MIRSFFDPIIHFENLYFKAKYENILEDSSSSVGKKLRFFVNMCILIGVFSLIFSTVENLHQKYASYFFFFDFIVSSVFLLEYWYRFQRAERKLKFFFHPQRIIELFSFAPFFLGILFVPLMGLDILKLLRLFSVFRLFSFSTQSPLVKGFLKSLSEYKDEYGGVFGVFASILIIFSTLVYYAEHMHNPDFSSIPQALWWGIVTMATVGYGDMYPITVYGKIFGSVLILLGPVILAILSSITILVFMDVAEHTHDIPKDKVCIACSGFNPLPARYCMHCGKQKFSLSDDFKNEKKSWVKKIFS